MDKNWTWLTVSAFSAFPFGLKTSVDNRRSSYTLLNPLGNANMSIFVLSETEGSPTFGTGWEECPKAHCYADTYNHGGMPNNIKFPVCKTLSIVANRTIELDASGGAVVSMFFQPTPTPTPPPKPPTPSLPGACNRFTCHGTCPHVGQQCKPWYPPSTSCYCK